MRVKSIGEDPSWLDSWLLWRKLSGMGGGVQELFRQVGYHFPQPFYRFLEGVGTEVCPFCRGWGEINDPQHGRAYCLCTVLDWQQDLERRMLPFESYLAPAQLSDLAADQASPSDRQALTNAVRTVKEWLEWPDRWIVLWGSPGTGKSTILAAIKQELPLARYVTAYDFEQQMYRGQSDGTFDTYLELLSQAPVLLLDDWGAEYGRPLVHAKLSAVIDARDRVWQELLTVVATNLPIRVFKDYNMRMGSRLSDANKVEIIKLVIEDHRKAV